MDAARTAALLGLEGRAAFGAASLAFLRFTGGTGGAAAALALSLLFWAVVPAARAVRRLERTDI